MEATGISVDFQEYVTPTGLGITLFEYRIGETNPIKEKIIFPRTLMD
jgi:hypothetical protein